MTAGILSESGHAYNKCSSEGENLKVAKDQAARVGTSLSSREKTS